MLVKELQSLGLDIRTLDKNGEEIQLSSICNDDDDVVPYTNRADAALIDDATDNAVETDDMDDSYIIEDADDLIAGMEDEEDDFDMFGNDADDNM